MSKLQNPSGLNRPGWVLSSSSHQNEALLPQLNASANSKLHLLYVTVGAEDGLIATHGVLKQLLESKGVNVVWVETEGYNHEWAFWRVALLDFAPRLFQTASK
jgi:enterochelin esterase-like enzyme